MECPKCKSNTGVTRIVYNPYQRETYRYRYCKRCNYSFYTVEFEVEVNERFQADWKKHLNAH